MRSREDSHRCSKAIGDVGPDRQCVLDLICTQKLRGRILRTMVAAGRQGRNRGVPFLVCNVPGKDAARTRSRLPSGRREPPAASLHRAPPEVERASLAHLPVHTNLELRNQGAGTDPPEVVWEEVVAALIQGRSEPGSSRSSRGLPPSPQPAAEAPC